MVIIMARDAAESDLAAIVELITDSGGEAFISRGLDRTIVGVVGDIDLLDTPNLRVMPGVIDMVRISTPYKLVSREQHAARSTVHVRNVPVGPGQVTLMAGPCAVESFDQTLGAARMAQRAGAVILRGGAYKPRTSPYAFQGLGLKGLEILAEVGRLTGLPVVTEIVTEADLPMVIKHADMLQVGARNMQNFSLLEAVGGAGMPVLLKRGLSATIEEWLMAAEHIARRGNLEIILCERGIRTYEQATRNTLDISAVPTAQRLTHLPVIVDPSHAGGRRDLVLPLARAAVAVGADGIIVDVHPRPDTALCDGPQALIEEDLAPLLEATSRCAAAVGREMTRIPQPVR